MKKSMKFATALAGAAVVVVGGTAFTNSNTMPANPVSGTGSLTVSGINVDTSTYTYSADRTDLTQVVFVTTAGVQKDLSTGFTMTLRAFDGTPTLLASSTCSAVYTDGDPGPEVNTITCNYAADEVPIADLNSVTLTVTENGTT